MKYDPKDDDALACWFTPAAIRDSYDGVDTDDPNDPSAARRRWVDQQSDDVLVGISYECIGSDVLWELFHDLIDEAVDDRIGREST